MLSYQGKHEWIYRNWGKATHCEFCNVKGKRYQWANVSEEYKLERSDWKQLCVSCHKKYDNQKKIDKGLPQYTLKTHCSRGHEFTPENIRWRYREKTTVRICKKCHIIRMKKYYYKTKLAKENSYA